MKRIDLFLITFIAFSCFCIMSANTQIISFPSSGGQTLEQKYPPVDSIVTLFTWVWDDGLDDLYNVWKDSFEVYDQKASCAIITWSAIHGVAGHMTASQLQELSSVYGWEMIGHGWSDAKGATPTYPDLWSAYGADTDIRAMCRGEVSYDDYLTDARNCYAGFDTLGLPPPRGWSSPNNSTMNAYKHALEVAGFEFGFAPSNTASGPGSRYNWLKELESYASPTFTKVAAYPNCLPPRFEILQCSGESDSYSTFTDRVDKAIALKGSWIVFVGHTPTLWETAKSFDFEDALAYLKTKMDAGVLRVVTPSEAYDILWNRPISESANFLWANFENNNADAYLDLMWPSRQNVTPYRDKIYTDPEDPDHGVFGKGYATLDWDAAPDNVTGWSNQSIDDWIEQYDCVWMLPNFARGKAVQFECWVQIDQSIEDVYTTPLSSADSIGVTFGAFRSRQGLQAGSSLLNWIGPSNAVVQSGGATIHSGWISYNLTQEQASNYSTFVLGAGDTVGGNWMHITATFASPIDAEILQVILCKDERFDAGSVRISNPTLSIFERARNKW